MQTPSPYLIRPDVEDVIVVLCMQCVSVRSDPNEEMTVMVMEEVTKREHLHFYLAPCPTNFSAGGEGARLLEPGRETLQQKTLFECVHHVRTGVGNSPVLSLCRLRPIPYLPYPNCHLDLLFHIANDPRMVQYLLR